MAINKPAPVGRPTVFKEEIGEQILYMMAQGYSLAAAAASVDVHRQRVYDWEKKHPEFADTIKLARVKRQLFLEGKLLGAKDGPTVTSSIFALKNAAPDDWREKQHVEADVKVEDVTGAKDELARKLSVAIAATPESAVPEQSD